LPGIIRKELDANDCGFGHFGLVLSLHYLVKCRSHTLAIYNNKFILDSARVRSEMINWKATNTISNYCISKSHTCHIASYILQQVLKIPARMQATNVDTTRKQQAQQPAFQKVVERQH